MANAKISQLPPVTPMDGTELTACVQGGQTRKARFNQVPSPVTVANDDTVSLSGVSTITVRTNHGLTLSSSTPGSATINVNVADGTVANTPGVVSDGFQVFNGRKFFTIENNDDVGIFLVPDTSNGAIFGINTFNGQTQSFFFGNDIAGISVENTGVSLFCRLKLDSTFATFEVDAFSSHTPRFGVGGFPGVGGTLAGLVVKGGIITTLPSAASFLNSLLPSQAGNAGLALKTDGTNVFWG